MNPLYFEAITEGFLLGFGLAFLIGPAFFALLQASIDHGFNVSVALAFGVVISDCLLMTFSYILLKELNAIPYFHTILALTGGVVLIFSGMTMVFKPGVKGPALKVSMWDIWHLFRKGFSINTFNPFPWMFWLSTSALVSEGIGKNNSQAAFLFYLVAALTVFGTDVAKAWAAQYLLKFLKPSILSRFRLISGLCLAGFGVRLLFFALESWEKHS